ncbi:MAG: PPOX class F420-dependent oxidoreductase [Phototrophicales bacterium]|nr:MAG: PPOX class F420-dependent oxidoreductase [Phototrophicales bacterium]
MIMIPESHRDLLERPVIVSLATVLPDGQPQVTPVWIDYDGEYLRVNSAAGRQKDKNMRRNSKVTIMALDPDNGYRWLEVRGEVVKIDESAGLEHINSLSAKYRNQPDYYASMPQMRGKEQRVMYKIRPVKVTKGG